MIQKQLAAELGSIHTLRKIYHHGTLWDSKGKLLKEPYGDRWIVGPI